MEWVTPHTKRTRRKPHHQLRTQCQKQAAEKLGITPAAVCQYVSHKRGNKTIDDEELMKEIKLSTQRIPNDTDDAMIKETCRICKIFMAKGIFPSGCDSCEHK